jgi:putative phage-type endonuclease
MPRVERLVQGTPEWQRWRLQGIGGSDAPVIMGDSRYRTPRVLWTIKTGKTGEQSDSAAAQRGRDLEGLARQVYEARLGIQMEPLCVTHDRLDWMRASLDGISFDAAVILEIKCPLSSRDHALARAGQIPPHYIAQLQHQLEVTGAEEAHYWSFDGKEGVLVCARPEPEYIRRLVDAEEEFWQRVIENRWPGDEEGELDRGTDDEWRVAASDYRTAKARLAEASASEEAARKQLERLATARRTYGCGVEVLRSVRKGAVNYAAVPELRGVDLEPYRRSAVEVVRINLAGEPGR